MEFLNSLECAQRLDTQDALKPFRNNFIIPQVDGGNGIYFLGNSLGLQPKRTADYIQDVLTQWSRFGVEGFFKGSQPWLRYHDHLVQPLAAVVGALPHEVVVMNQLTVNLHLMLVSFYQPAGKRTKILCEAKAFPSDQYMLETHLRQRGLDPEEHIIEVTPEQGQITIRHEAILQKLEEHKEEIALVFWGGVNYYTGQLFNMQAIAEAAHKAGASVGFDLAHAAGNVPLLLHQWNVDFACWCSYKYLNAGPGAVGGVFVHERHHQDKSLNRFGGWWGYKQDTRFLMQKGFQPIPSAEGWALSTPSPLLFAAHQAALEIFAKAGMDALISKSRLLTTYLLFLLQDITKKFHQPFFKVLTPTDERERGCQLSILVEKNGKELFDQLAEKGVFADWREPDTIRVAPVPLYNTFEEVWRFGAILEQALIRLSHA
jgi:kynureninase